MKNILIVRLSSMGDVVMASPLIMAFRTTWPGANVSWLVEESSRPVLEANPNLHKVIVWERERWRRLLRKKRLITLGREAVSLILKLRREKYDLAVDTQGLLKSGIWTFLSGTKERVGLGSKEGSRCLMTRVVERSGPSDRMSSQYLLLAEELGLSTEPFSMEVSLSPEAETFAAGFADSLSSPYAVFAPFTTRPQKHWVEERWTELASRISEETGLGVALLGGPGDETPAESILPDGDPSLVNLAGRTSIQEAAAVISRSSLLVGVDTGLTHMGFALGVPTVALFGATRPYLNVEGMPGAVLYHPRECSPCRRRPTCDENYPCMHDISVDEVFQTARKALGRVGKP